MSAWEPSESSHDASTVSRRRFLAGVSSAAAAAWIGLGSDAAAQAAPAGPAPMPTIQLGPHRISRIVAGSNPILGYSPSRTLSPSTA